MGSNHRREQELRVPTRPLLDYIDQVRRKRASFVASTGSDGLLGLNDLLGETCARWLRHARQAQTISLSRVDTILTRLDHDCGLVDLYPELYA